MLRIAVVSERPGGVGAAWVRTLLSCTWRTLGRKRSAWLSVAIVGRRTSATLNARYRKRAGATNVLSFALPDPKTGMLGEIILCLPVARAEARRYGRTLRGHVALLLIHGLLHLLGEDHVRTRDRERMERREQRLLAHCLLNP